MAVKIVSLREDEIRDIGDAFADFKYAESEFGMAYLAKDRQAVSDYICSYARMTIRERSLYSTSYKHEGFIAFSNPGAGMSLGSAADILKTVPGRVDMKHLFTMAKGCMHAGKTYGSILSGLKIPHIYVSMVAVRKEYQGKGFMRKLLEIAFEEGRRQAVPVVLDTDAVLKKDKYEHLGMKCVVTQHFADGVELYGLVYEPDNLPKEWKSEVVLEDRRILSAHSRDIWDRFAPVYSGFVTGTPGNRRAYDAIYRRIRSVIRDKEVLELATGPGVIAKQVADEAGRMVATDYSEKMLAVARRGIVPENLVFERADASALSYDDESFDVIIIANALHIIPQPEKVLSEIRRVLRKDGLLIAPNFIHDNRKKVSGLCSKALSFAGVTFEAKWDAQGYIRFLQDHGFRAEHTKQLQSTIPLMYTECTIEDDRIDSDGDHGTM
ncbi:MAG: GNAT family N-acetyltransferase [Lachnospiraceae bacterium]|nr:GNAT family N-acetyltransferase [Lachnospiraceae bacterium]